MIILPLNLWYSNIFLFISKGMEIFSDCDDLAHRYWLSLLIVSFHVLVFYDMVVCHCSSLLIWDVWFFKVINFITVYLLENNFFFKINFKKINYFLIFGSVMKNKLENNLLIFYFLKFIKITSNKSYKLKSWMRMKLKKNIIS